MRNRFSLLIALAALLAASLACNMPVFRSNNPTDRMIVIDSLAVSPRESNGENDLTVTFNYTPGTIDTSIICSVVNPSGDEQRVWSGPFGKGADTIKYPADFSIRVTEPGNYTLHCWDSIGPASESTTFSITAPAQPTGTEVGGFPRHKPGEITSGGLWFTFENGAAGWCLPGVNYTQYGGTSSLDVAADGKLSGTCHMSMYGGDGVFDSTLDGTWNGDTGKISFHLKTIMVYTATINKNTQNEESGSSTTIYEFNGSGEMTSEYQATGDAPYTTTCTTTNSKAVLCNPNTTGTVHWQINFNP